MHHLFAKLGLTVCGALLWSGVASAAQDDESPEPIDEEAAAVSQLLDAAWSGNAPLAAEMHASLKTRVKDKSRWHYAYGLAALKLKRQSDAIRAFEAALKESETFELGVWKGLIGTELNLKRYDNGLSHLEELARTVCAEDFKGRDEDRGHAATWIGQAVVAIERVASGAKVQKQLAETNDRLAGLWPEELADAYQSGREYSQALYDDLMSDMKETSDKVLAKEQQAREEKVKSLQGDIADADQKRGDLKKSAAELQKQAEQRALQIDKQLARLERDYNLLETRAASLLQSMAYLQRQAEMMGRDGTYQGGNGRYQVVGSRDVLQEIEYRLGMYQQEYQDTLYRGGLIVQQATQGVQQRQQLQQGLEQAVGELGARDASLDKWQQRLTKSGEKIKNSKIKVKSPSLSQKRRQAKTLSTYLEFDPEWERIQLTERTEEQLEP